MSSLDPSVLFAALPFSLWQWLLVELAIVLAYVVFGIAGFGTALVAGPLLAGVLPLSQIIPLLVLLDFSASFGNWLPNNAPNSPPKTPKGNAQVARQRGWPRGWRNSA